MKIIFVGVHNKPGLKPLCSSTRSGKLIDRIITEGMYGDRTWLKTNLFDVDFEPDLPITKTTFAEDWWNRIHANRNDIIVLLGQTVHDYFIPKAGKIVKIKHPSYPRSKKDKDSYVKEAIKRINYFL